MYIPHIRLSNNHQAYPVKVSILFSHPSLFLQFWNGMEKSVFQASNWNLASFHLRVSGLVFLRGLFSISQQPWWWWMMGAGTLVFSISPSGSHLSRISHKRSRRWCSNSTVQAHLYWAVPVVKKKKKQTKSSYMMFVTSIFKLSYMKLNEKNSRASIYYIFMVEVSLIYYCDAFIFLFSK